MGHGGLATELEMWGFRLVLLMAKQHLPPQALHQHPAGSRHGQACTGQAAQQRHKRRGDAGPAQGSFYTLRKLTCWWLLPDTIWGTYRQEELALLVLGGGQVSFTYCFSSAP